MFVKVFPVIFPGLYILFVVHIIKEIKMRIKLMEERILKSHKISIFNRSSGIISGVKDSDEGGMTGEKGGLLRRLFH